MSKLWFTVPEDKVGTIYQTLTRLGVTGIHVEPSPGVAEIGASSPPPRTRNRREKGVLAAVLKLGKEVYPDSFTATQAGSVTGRKNNQIHGCISAAIRHKRLRRVGPGQYALTETQNTLMNGS